jgi:hypothetical protein
MSRLTVKHDPVITQRHKDLLSALSQEHARSPTIRSQLPMLTPVWRRAGYLFGGGRTSVGAARRCGLPALRAACGL